MKYKNKQSLLLKAAIGVCKRYRMSDYPGSKRSKAIRKLHVAILRFGKDHRYDSLD